MANFQMPFQKTLGRMFRSGKDASPVKEATVDSTDGDVVLERRLWVGRGPIGDLAAGRGRSTGLAIANSSDDSVSILNPETLELVGTVAVGAEPIAVVAAHDRAFVATSSLGCDAVSVIDLDSLHVTATYEVASGVTALAASPDGKRVYAGRATDDRVELTVIDTTAERVGTIDVGSAPAANIDAVLVDANGKRLYVAVTDATGSQLVVLDAETTRVTRVVPVGSPIRDIAAARNAIYVLTSDRASGGAVHAVDLATGRVTDTAVFGGAPTQLSVSPDEARAYVVDYDRVAVLDSLTLDVVESLRTAARPSAVASTPDGSRLFVTDFSGSVTVFAVESTVESLYSQFLATDPIALSAPRALQRVPA